MIKAFPYLLSILLFLFSISVMAKEQEEEAMTPETLIIQLGAENEDKRIQAEECLWQMGAKVIPLLENALKSEDPEISYRAAKLLPRIRAGIPLNEESPLSEFMELYFSSDRREKATLMMSFLNREELTPEEATGVLFIIKNDPEISSSQDPLLLNTKFHVKKSLEVITENYLNKADTLAAANVWKKTEADHSFFSRYAALISNAGLTPDTSNMEPEHAQALTSYIALLQGDKDKALNTAPPGNKFLQRLFAATDFDYSGSWSHILDKDLPMEGWSVPELYIVYSHAELKGDAKTKKEVINRLRHIAETRTNVRSVKISPYSSLHAISTLYSLGEVKTADACIAKLICEAIPENTDPGRFIEVVRHPFFDITLLGVKKDTLDSILEEARSIVARIKAKEEINSLSGNDSQKVIYEKRLAALKILAFSYYLDERGEADSIMPVVRDFIGTNSSIVDYSIFFFSSFMSARKSHLAYEILQHLYKHAPNNSEVFVPLEKILFYNTRDFNMRFWDDGAGYATGLLYLDATLPEDTSREEKVRQLLILSDSITGKDGESEELFNTLLVHLRKDDNPELVDSLGTCFLWLAMNQQNDSKFIRLMEALPRHVSFPETEHAYLFFYGKVCELLPNSIIELYRNSLKSRLEKHPLFFPQTEKTSDDNEDSPFPYDSLFNIGSAYSLLLYRTGDEETADKMAKIARLFSPQENMARLRQTAGLGYFNFASDFLLERLFPFYGVDDDYHSQAFMGIILQVRLWEDQRYKESEYMITSIASGFSYLSYFDISECAAA